MEGDYMRVKMGNLSFHCDEELGQGIELLKELYPAMKNVMAGVEMTMEQTEFNFDLGLIHLDLLVTNDGIVKFTEYNLSELGYPPPSFLGDKQGLIRYCKQILMERKLKR
jgi:hypothetical protein